MSVRRFRPICQFLEDGTPVAVLAEFHEGYVSGDDYDALRADRDSLQKRVTECESVMLHYGMETEHSCMCQFNDDTGELAGECAYHEKIRAERDEAVALLRTAVANCDLTGYEGAAAWADRRDALLTKLEAKP